MYHPQTGALLNPKYDKRQVARLLRQIEGLCQRRFLTDDFTNREIAELQSAL